MPLLSERYDETIKKLDGFLEYISISDIEKTTEQIKQSIAKLRVLTPENSLETIKEIHRLLLQTRIYTAQKAQPCLAAFISAANTTISLINDHCEKKIFKPLPTLEQIEKLSALRKSRIGMGIFSRPLVPQEIPGTIESSCKQLRVSG